MSASARGVRWIGVHYKGKNKPLISGPSFVRLIEGVRLIGGPLNRGFTVLIFSIGNELLQVKCVTVKSKTTRDTHVTCEWSFIYLTISQVRVYFTFFTNVLNNLNNLSVTYIQPSESAIKQRIYFTLEFQELLHQFWETYGLNIHLLSNAFTKTWLFTRNRISSLLVLHY